MMAPLALNLENATFGSIGAFSTAASPLRNSFSLSCRSPATPSFEDRPTPSSPSRHGPLLHTPNACSHPTPSSPPRQVFDKDGYAFQDNDENTLSAHSTWFLPRSPGLPPLAPSSGDGKLGVLSAINIIVGKTMGVGAYSVPSAIFSGVGSVGMTLALWVVGSLISFCGLAVYLDLGTALPRSGGEHVYLERIFRKPSMLATCMFMSYAVLLGFSTPNAIVLGEHALYVAGAAENRWNVRIIAVVAVSSLCYIHARHPRLGLCLLNTLGVAKMLILAVVVVSGIAGGLMGVGADREALLHDIAMAGDAPSSTAQRNFRRIWEGSSSQPYDYATALLKVLYCFRGYSTANQVLGELRDPVRTLKIAAPVALTFVSFAYLAINAAFFLVVDKDEFRTAGVVVAGVFFNKVFGDGLGAHILPLFVVISAAGNIAATSFAQARVNEELAKEGVLPKFWMSRLIRRDESSRTRTGRRGVVPPVRGLLLHWLVSVAAIVIPPPGKIFNFLVDIGGYPVSVLSVAVSFGLWYLHSAPHEQWTTLCKAPLAAILVFAASNCLLLVLPWIPPRGGMAEDGRFPSFTYPATSLGVLALGVLYWCGWRMMGGGNAWSSGKTARVYTEVPRNEEDHDDSESECTMVAEEELLRLKSSMDMADACGVSVCGCRACPEVRRRAVCGCAACPTRRSS